MDKEQNIQAIVELGFTAEQAKAALALVDPSVTDNSVVEQAINILISQQEEINTSLRSASSASEAKNDDSVEEEEEEDTDIKLMLIVRADLKMGVGKIAAQCSHATLV